MIGFGKKFAHGSATIIILPLVALFWLLALLSSKDRAISSLSQVLAGLPGITGCYLRAAFYCLVLDEFHPSARLEYGTLLSKCGARIASNVYVGPHCQLGLVTLGRDVLLGPSVQIPSGPRIHGIESLCEPIRTQPGRPQRIVIGRDCWIGGMSVVLADVQEQTVVGAGSIVTKPMPARVVAAGNPARVIRTREAGGEAE